MCYNLNFKFIETFYVHVNGIIRVLKTKRKQPIQFVC